MAFTIEELLSEEVCQWCRRKNCDLRGKIAGMKSCQKLQFDSRKNARHTMWNSVRMKLCLIYAFTTGHKDVSIDDSEFQEWAKQKYRGKTIDA